MPILDHNGPNLKCSVMSLFEAEQTQNAYWTREAARIFLGLIYTALWCLLALFLVFLADGLGLGRLSEMCL